MQILIHWSSSLKIQISYKLPGDIAAAGAQITVWAATV